jgi:hypothetical protein
MLKLIVREGTLRRAFLSAGLLLITSTAMAQSPYQRYGLWYVSDQIDAVSSQTLGSTNTSQDGLAITVKCESHGPKQLQIQLEILGERLPRRSAMVNLQYGLSTAALQPIRASYDGANVFMITGFVSGLDGNAFYNTLKAAKTVVISFNALTGEEHSYKIALDGARTALGLVERNCGGTGLLEVDPSSRRSRTLDDYVNRPDNPFRKR